jgi:hypothetical protein
MATIESAVRAMLINGTTLLSAGIPDSRIAHGYRLQDSILPACTYEVEQEERLSIGANALLRTRVELRIVAERTNDALGFRDELQTLCVAGTYDGYVFQAVEWIGHTVDPATTSDGDENQPAELVCTIEIHYTES